MMGVNKSVARPRWSKVLADLWGNKTRTLLIVLSISVGLLAVGTILSSRTILSTEMTLDQLFARMRSGGPHPTTSQPPPSAFADAYRAAERRLFLFSGGLVLAGALRIERVLGKQEGVDEAVVNFAGQEARLTVAAGIDLGGLTAAIERIGYSASVVDGGMSSGPGRALGSASHRR